LDLLFCGLQFPFTLFGSLGSTWFGSGSLPFVRYVSAYVTYITFLCCVTVVRFPYVGSTGWLRLRYGLLPALQFVLRWFVCSSFTFLLPVCVRFGCSCRLRCCPVYVSFVWLLRLVPRLFTVCVPGLFVTFVCCQLLRVYVGSVRSVPLFVRSFCGCYYVTLLRLCLRIHHVCCYVTFVVPLVLLLRLVHVVYGLFHVAVAVGCFRLRSLFTLVVTFTFPLLRSVVLLRWLLIRCLLFTLFPFVRWFFAFVRSPAAFPVLPVCSLRSGFVLRLVRCSFFPRFPSYVGLVGSCYRFVRVTVRFTWFVLAIRLRVYAAFLVTLRVLRFAFAFTGLYTACRLRSGYLFPAVQFGLVVLQFGLVVTLLLFWTLDCTFQFYVRSRYGLFAVYGFVLRLLRSPRFVHIVVVLRLLRYVWFFRWFVVGCGFGSLVVTVV